MSSSAPETFAHFARSDRWSDRRLERPGTTGSAAGQALDTCRASPTHLAGYLAIEQRTVAGVAHARRDVSVTEGTGQAASMSAKRAVEGGLASNWSPSNEGRSVEWIGVVVRPDASR